MGTFTYCTSQDHLDWELANEENVRPTCIVLHRDHLKDKRREIREWVNNGAFGNVYCWNCVVAPAHGDKDWADKIVAYGNAVLYFTDERDCTFARLKWLKGSDIE